VSAGVCPESVPSQVVTVELMIKGFQQLLKIAAKNYLIPLFPS